MIYKELDMNDGNYYTRRGYIKSLLPPNVHLPNKNEAKLLRKIKSDTGLSEEEIRDIKKYRIMLSEAQDMGEKEKPHQKQKKFLAKILKSITKELKLAKEHPLVVAEYKKQLKKLNDKNPYWSHRL